MNRAQNEPVRVLNQSLSHVLRAYYFAPNFPTKLRWWTWLRRATGYARLRVPYAGSWFSVDERDHIQNMIWQTGAYEPEIWDGLAPFLKPGDVMWDVGGNVGAFTFKCLADTRIAATHVFEPAPWHAEILEWHLAQHPRRAHARVHRIALSDAPRQATLYRAGFPHLGGANLVRDLGYGAVTIECRTADQMLDAGVPPPNLVKLDIEDAEWQFLCGAVNLFANEPPRAVVLEGNSDTAGNIQDAQIAEWLAARGYVLHWLKRPEGAVYHRENYLAVRMR